MNIPLKVRIMERNILQTQLARDVGISEACLSRMVHGWNTPPQGIKKRLADRLRCSQRDIFPKAEIKPVLKAEPVSSTESPK
jgi:DNA-binding Xre family transcriptional regulator